MLAIHQRKVIGALAGDAGSKENGRSGEIRTRDPHNPIVVRYQAALRSESVNSINNRAARHFLAPQHLQDVFELAAHLAHELLAARHVVPGRFTLELLARAEDREPLLVQQ